MGLNTALNFCDIGKEVTTAPIWFMFAIQRDIESRNMREWDGISGESEREWGTADAIIQSLVLLSL